MGLAADKVCEQIHPGVPIRFERDIPGLKIVTKISSK
jgi:hypothetical protein